MKKHYYSVIGLFFLVSCASSPNKETPKPVEPPTNSSNTVASDDKRQKPAIDLNDFLGRPVSALEGVLGKPDFIRAEGVGEFRRYDRQDCRIYALIGKNESGRSEIKSISLGGVKLNQTPPSLSECL